MATERSSSRQQYYGPFTHMLRCASKNAPGVFNSGAQQLAAYVWTALYCQPHAVSSSNTVCRPVRLSVSMVNQGLFVHAVYTKTAQKPQLSPMDRAMRCVSWNIAKCCTNVRQIASEKSSSREWPQGHSRSIEMVRIDMTYDICDMWHFPLVVCTNDVAVLHHFWDTTTSTVYVTVCNL